MAAEPTFESLCCNVFLAKDYLNDSNQDPDVNFYNDISSIETSFFLHLNIRSMTKNFETFYNSIIH